MFIKNCISISLIFLSITIFCNFGYCDTPEPPQEPQIPEPIESCPELNSSMYGTKIQVLGREALVWVGQKQENKKGKVFFYWHGTGGVAQSVKRHLGMDIIDEIVNEGGIVVSFQSESDSLDMADAIIPGTNTTCNGVWYLDDYLLADQILACAVRNPNLNIDTHAIYSGGSSAGGLHSGTMAIARSGYLAGVMLNSGGISRPLVDIYMQLDWQNPDHIPYVVTSHGGIQDFAYGLFFIIPSLDLDIKTVNAGGFAVDCNHGGRHNKTPPDMRDAQWKFLKNHRFGTDPSPYVNGLPAYFPDSCEIVDDFLIEKSKNQLNDYLIEKLKQQLKKQQLKKQLIKQLIKKGKRK